MNAVLDINTSLRPMLQGDVAIIARVEQEIYQYPWTAQNFKDSLTAGYSCWVYEVEAELVGYTIMMMVLDEAHLLNIGIARPWQRRGLGRALLMHSFDYSRGHGARAMLLEVRPSNIPARRLYAQSGFRQVGERRNYYPAVNGRENALILELKL